MDAVHFKRSNAEKAWQQIVVMLVPNKSDAATRIAKLKGMVAGRK